MDMEGIVHKLGNGTATVSEAIVLAECGANVTICAKTSEGLPLLFFRADPEADMDSEDCLGFTARVQQALERKDGLRLVQVEDPEQFDCSLGALWKQADPTTVYMMPSRQEVRCFYGREQAAEFLNAMAIAQSDADDAWQDKHGEETEE